LGLSRLPVLVDCLLENQGDHAAVLIDVLIQPLRNANEKLVKLKEMVETTIDLNQADRGDFIIKADFDDQLGGIEICMRVCQVNHEVNDLIRPSIRAQKRTR
jgi:DNA mismatch repair protein MSH2